MLFLVGLLKRVTKNQIYALLALAALSVIGGGIAFSVVESVSIGTGLYWAVTTATTVGYGDVTPHNPAGRVIAVLEMLTAIPLFAGVFAGVTAWAASLQIRRLLHMDRHLPAPGYIAIYGSHSVVPRVTRDLLAAGRSVVVVAAHATDDALPDGVHVIAGDPTSEDVIRRSVPRDAARVLVATMEEGDALITTVLVRHLAPDTPVTAIVDSDHVARALTDLGTDQTLSAEALIGHLVAKSLETPHAPALVRSLLESPDFALREVPVSETQEGQPLGAVRTEAEDLVLAVVRDGHVDLGVDESVTLHTRDRLLVLARTSKTAKTS